MEILPAFGVEKANLDWTCVAKYIWIFRNATNFPLFNQQSDTDNELIMWYTEVPLRDTETATL